MAAPVWEGVGSSAAGVGTNTPTRPGSIGANDILVAIHESADAPPSAPGGGWAAVADSPQHASGGSLATQTGLGVYWVRGDPGSDPTFADTGNHGFVIIGRISGCITTGDPWDVTAGNVLTTADTAVSIPGDTTTVNDCLIVAICTTALDSTVGDFSGWANSDLTSVTERLNIGTDVGNGGGIGVVTGVKATAGTFGATTATLGTSSKQARIVIAFKPPASTIPSGSATGSIAWVGEATGARTSAGSGSGTISWVGEATGTNVHSGAATGSITWAGSATGEMPAEVNDGSATGAIDWAGSASGTRTSSGSASGTITWAGSANGATGHSGTSSGTISWAGSATGSATHQGASTGTITWAGSAIGESPAEGVSEGSADGAISWSGVATGTSTRSGASVGNITWSGAAAGITSYSGSATGAIDWVGSATGQQPSQFYYWMESGLGVVSSLSGGGGVTNVEGG